MGCAQLKGKFTQVISRLILLIIIEITFVYKRLNNHEEHIKTYVTRQPSRFLVYGLC
jgi:hypothetical protein